MGSGRGMRALVCLLLATGAGRASGVDPDPTRSAAKAEAVVPRLFGAANGRFAVIAESGEDGPRLAELAEAAWDKWREPLGLPLRLPAAITVRLVPESLWGFGSADSHVTAEPGGVVSVWIRGGGSAGVARERRWLRALAEGTLRRKAFLQGVDPARAQAPAWLVAGAAEAVITTTRPSMFDAWQAAVRSATGAMGLREVLFQEGGGDVERGAPEAYGVWLWLREEGGRSGAWAKFVTALLAGESPGAALAREYAALTPRPAEAREWELAWRVASAGLARARATPVLEPEETRRRLEALSRIVAMDTKTGAERLVHAWGEWAMRGEPWLEAELAERSRLIVAEFAQLHPFYRNAAGSLGRAWAAWAAGREDAWREASEEWARDMETGRTLEAASARLLDELEAELRAAGP